MIREIVNIDEEKCDGCGLCIPTCHEGALQIIEGKARLISELMCDGLGNCLGHCPQDAITIEKREAEDYSETLVIEKMIPKGEKTVIAHLKHLKEHNEFEYLKEAIDFLESCKTKIAWDVSSLIKDLNEGEAGKSSDCGGGCPGAASREIKRNNFVGVAPMGNEARSSKLQQWPIQLHLINPDSAYFKNADLLIAADCTAFAYGDFHSFIEGKKLAIACPKLDQGQDVYINKIVSMINNSELNTITVAIMEVPCCSGLAQMVQLASQKANRKVPIKIVVIGIDGSIQSNEWL